MIRVGLVDDHQLFLKSLSLMLETLGMFEVTVEALNGQALQPILHGKKELPDIILIDVNMPVMDGIATAQWLQEAYPQIKLVALSMNDKETSIINMFKSGCCAYLLKDVHPSILEKALQQVYLKGYYNADAAAFNPGRLLRKDGESLQISLTVKERLFLQQACSDLTYKEIAAKMDVSERTVDGYRESLFSKFSVQSRVGLCLEAIRKGFVEL